MQVNKVNSNTNFKGVKILGGMPKTIVKAIKDNPVISNAGKHYSVHFRYSYDNYYKMTKGSDVICVVTTPDIDSKLALMLTPPHSIRREAFFVGADEPEVLSTLDIIKNTPDFFEKKIGTPRTLKQKITAFFESLQIAFFPYPGDSKVYDAKLKKILDKYRTMNMPQPDTSKADVEKLKGTLDKYKNKTMSISQ